MFSTYMQQRAEARMSLEYTCRSLSVRTWFLVCVLHRWLQPEGLSCARVCVYSSAAWARPEVVSYIKARRAWKHGSACQGNEWAHFPQSAGDAASVRLHEMLVWNETRKRLDANFHSLNKPFDFILLDVLLNPKPLRDVLTLLIYSSEFIFPTNNWCVTQKHSASRDVCGCFAFQSEGFSRTQTLHSVTWRSLIIQSESFSHTL